MIPFLEEGTLEGGNNNLLAVNQNNGQNNEQNTGQNNSSLINFPLIAPFNSINGFYAQNPYGRAVYFGTGVVTPTAISQGLPFDYWGLLLTAEWMRRRTGATEIIQEISDTHALKNSTQDPTQIKAMVAWQKAMIETCARTLGLPYRCVLASDYQSCDAFERAAEDIERQAPSDMLPYVRDQSAGNLYMRREEGVRCKVGWLTDDDENSPKFDERRFNREYNELGLDPLCFIYTWSGWCFDSKGNARVSPYTLQAGERRLTFQKSGDTLSQLQEYRNQCSNEKIVQSCFVQMARILTAYEQIYGAAWKKSFWTHNSRGPNDCVELKKIESWMSARYLDVPAMAAAIDCLRPVTNPPPSRKENSL
jgi:hypothetical protein